MGPPQSRGQFGTPQCWTTLAGLPWLVCPAQGSLALARKGQNELEHSNAGRRGGDDGGDNSFHLVKQGVLMQPIWYRLNKTCKYFITVVKTVVMDGFRHKGGWGGLLYLDILWQVNSWMVGSADHVQVPPHQRDWVKNPTTCQLYWSSD